GRKLVDEAGGGIGDVDDGLVVAGDSDGLSELAGAVAMDAPGVDVLEGRWRCGSGGGLRGARAGAQQRGCDKQEAWDDVRERTAYARIDHYVEVLRVPSPGTLRMTARWMVKSK